MLLERGADQKAVTSDPQSRTGTAPRIDLTRRAAALIGFALLYLAGAAVARMLAIMPGSGISMWPPAGLLLGWLLANRRRQWPGLAVAGAVADLLANAMWFHNPILLAVLLYGANLFSALAGATLIKMSGRPVPFYSVQQVGRLALLGAGVAQVISATVGSLSLSAWDLQVFWSAWPMWWVGDLTGVLIFAPLVLTFPSLRRLRQVSAESWVELAVTFAGLLILSGLFLTGVVPFAYIIAPVLLWSAVRFHLVGSVLSMATFVTLIALSSAVGLRVVPEGDARGHELISLQLFVSMTALGGMLVAAAAREQTRAIRRLERSRRLVERLAGERGRHLEMSELRMRTAARAARLAWMEAFDPSSGDGIRVSDSFPGIYGMEAGRPVNFAAVVERVHPEDRKAFLRAYRRVASKGGEFDLTFRVVTTDGELRWLNAVGVAEIGAIGKRRPVTAISFDITQSKVTQEWLYESQHQLSRHLLEVEALYAGAPMGLAMLDRNLLFVRVNPALAGMNGFTVEEHIGKSAWDLVPDLRDKAEPMFRKVLESGQPLLDVPLQGYTASRPGVLREWRAQIYPIRSTDGTVSGLGVICEEVTERVRLERAVRDNARKLQLILDSTLAFVGILETDGTLIEANLPALEAGGLTREETIGRKFWDCYWWNYDPDVVGRLKDAVGQAAAGQTVRYDAVVRIRGDSRMTIAFMLSPVRDADGRIIYLVPSGFDISERTAVAERLRESEELYRGVFENAGTGILLADLNGQVLSFNPAFAAMAGIVASDPALIGQRLCQWVYPDDAELCGEWLESVAANGTGSTEEVEVRFAGSEDALPHVRLHGSLLHDAGGRPQRMIVLATDVTAAHQAALRQEVLQRELEHRSKNLMAVIQSIANRTFVTGVDMAAARKAFGGRISALARSQDSLSLADFGRTWLADVVQRQLAPFGQRIQCDGPALMLSSRHTQTFALIVHELATNAVKHGALSVPTGQVRLVWSVVGPQDDFLDFHWQERGGPPAQPPDQTGFGSLLITTIAGSSLNCTPELTYGPEGFEYRLRVALATILPELQEGADDSSSWGDA